MCKRVCHEIYSTIILGKIAGLRDLHLLTRSWHLPIFFLFQDVRLKSLVASRPGGHTKAQAGIAAGDDQQARNQAAGGAEGARGHPGNR